MHYLSENNILIFLIQVFILLGLARILGELFRRWKQPPVTAEILVGILIGPTILGNFTPDLYGFLFPKDILQQNMLETVSWLGVLFLLLQTGLEIDFSSAWRQRGDALKIASADIIIPMIISFIPCFFLPARYLVNPDQRVIFALFMATVMTISSMPIAARVLHDLKLSKTDLGFLIMSALSVNDIIGWVIFTIVLGFFTQANFEIFKAVLIFASSVGFTVLCLSIGRNFANNIILYMRKIQVPEPGGSLTFICLLGLLCGAITQKIGIHALFGFFLAGIMVGEAKALSERTRQIISQMVYAIFVPLFFVGIGLKVDFLSNFDFFLVLLVTSIGICGRFLGAWIGVNITKNSRTDREIIAIAHTPGGTMEIVVGVLALEFSLITEPIFVAIVFGAVFSSVILGPWLRHSMRKRKEISIIEFFSSRAIIPELTVSTKEGVITELSRIAAQIETSLNPDDINKLVLERENTIGTAVEEGIAFPHARLPEINKPLIVFARSARGLDWNSPDGKPTKLIFLILTPLINDTAQVQILASIARVMSDPAARYEVNQGKDSNEIWQTLQKLLN